MLKNIKIKLSSNYQQIEFDIEDINENLSGAVELINRLGQEVINSAGAGKIEKREEMATPNQIKALKAFGVKGEGLTKKKASEILTNLYNNEQ